MYSHHHGADRLVVPAVPTVVVQQFHRLLGGETDRGTGHLAVVVAGRLPDVQPVGLADRQRATLEHEARQSLSAQLAEILDMRHLVGQGSLGQRLVHVGILHHHQVGPLRVAEHVDRGIADQGELQRLGRQNALSFHAARSATKA
jgi:hypothetical protein